MIDHVWTVVCSTVVIDKETNNVSLQNILEQLTITELVVPEGGKFDDIESLKVKIPYKFSVVSYWSRNDIKKRVMGYGRVRLYSPNQELLISSPDFEIDLHTNRRFRSNGKFDGFPVQGAGKYEFRIYMKIDEESTWDTVAIVPVEVKIPDKKKWKKLQSKIKIDQF